jgi:thiamine-monophosphate kinase
VSLGEFELIDTYFRRPARHAALGVGDDCALLETPSGLQLAVSCDTLVAGRHFAPDADARSLGHKALAVNLSDLAACGARPSAFLLALTLPRVDEVFLAAFAQGLWALADLYAMDLIGGDTTSGPLSMTITVFGEVPRGQALLRSGARAGDDVWVSGTLGDARLALEAQRGRLSAATPALLDAARARLDRPSPRVALGQALRGVASAAVDVSDGLLADLGHVVEASSRAAGLRLGARIDAGALPLSEGVAALAPTWQLDCALAGGDDYELCFTAPAQLATAVEAAAGTAGVPVTRIGRIEAGGGVQVLQADGRRIEREFGGFDHFLS